jgi:hypothetical protein
MEAEPQHWVLHSRPQLDNEWWACDYPERPLDNNSECDLFCPGCFAAAEAHVAMNPGRLTWTYTPQRPEGEPRLWSSVLEEHVNTHGRPCPSDISELPEGTLPEEIITW